MSGEREGGDPTHPLDPKTEDSEPDTRAVAGPPSDGPRSKPSHPSRPSKAPKLSSRPSLGSNPTPAELERMRAQHAALLEGARKVLLPRFEPTRVIGRGGMGLVVGAHHVALGREVAVKLIPSEALKDETSRTRFEREARSAALLKHPSVVAVHDIDLEHGFIVMELCEGVSLSRHLYDNGKLPPAEVRRIGLAVLDALEAAHALGIVHRDVKPGNILIEPGGGVKLADFGVAYWGEDASITRDGLFVGTPAYMPPEQLRARVVDGRADVYAAGATLFEAATGRKFHSESDSVTNPRAAVLTATGDEALAAALERAVQELPELRFQSASEFARALGSTVPTRALEVTRTAAIPLEPVAATQAPVSPRSRLPAILGAAALIAALAFALWPAPVPIHKRVSVALLPFAGHAALGELDFGTSGLPHLLGTDLQKIEGLDVLGYYRVKGQIRSHEATGEEWTEAARALGADLTIRGEIEPAKDAGLVRVTVTLGPPSGRSIASWDRTVPVREVPGAVRALTSDIASRALGRSVRAVVPSADFEHQRQYVLGVAALERQRIAEAISALEAALALDASSPAASYSYAVALWWADRRPVEVITAIERGLSVPQGPAQAAFLSGLKLLTERRYPECIDYFTRARRDFPDDRDLNYGLFEALFHGGHPEAAYRAYRELAKRYPAFTLGAMHAFTWAILHGTPEEVEWALGHMDVERDPLMNGWQARARMARREYAAAIEELRELSERVPDSTGAYGTEETLVWAYALAGQLELASSVLGAVEERLAPKPFRASIPRASIERVRGAEAAFELLRARDIKALLAEGSAYSSMERWQYWILLELPNPQSDRLGAYAEGLRAATSNREDPRVIMLELWMAAADPLAPFDARSTKSNIVEVRATAEGVEALRAKQWVSAARAFERAAQSAGDGRFVLQEQFFAARAFREAGDWGGVVRACDEVIHPRLFDWPWAALVGDCLLYTHQAATRLGDAAAAERARARLLALRTGAGPEDRLLRELPR